MLSWLLLHQEEQLRTSTEIQRKMAEAEESGWKTWLDVVDELQMDLCRKCHIDPALGIRLLRNPIHSSLHSISLYRRHNKVKRCSIPLGQPVPEIPMTRILPETSNHQDEKKIRYRSELVPKPFTLDEKTLEIPEFVREFHFQ